MQAFIDPKNRQFLKKVLQENFKLSYYIQPFKGTVP